MFHILHGDNALRQEEILADIIEKTGVPADMQDFNTETLVAPVTLTTLRQACSTVPFMGGARIVVAYNVLSTSKGKLSQEIASYLPNVPSSTHLVFVERKKLPTRHKVLKLAKKTQSPIHMCALPNARSLPQWIQQRVRQYGGNIDGRAAAILAQNIGTNLRLLDQEIQKLQLYCGERKNITIEDVQVMVPYVQSADVIFNLVDAIGQRNASQAAHYLHLLLDVGEHPLGIFGMIVRQFRLLIQIQWLVDQHFTERDIASRLSLHPYVAKKVRAQTIHFTPAQLRTAYQLLAETDLAIKQGQLPADTALDLLIAQLTRL